MPNLQPHWGYFIALDDDLWALRRYIDFDSKNLGTYSIECHRVIQMAALEVEAVLLMMCQRILNLTCTNGNRTWSFKKLVTKIDNHVFKTYNVRLEESEVRFLGLPELRKPFVKSKGPTYPWWDAYTSLKHGRHQAMAKGSLENALDAVGALAILLSLFGLEVEKRQSRGVAEFYPHTRVTVSASTSNRVWASNNTSTGSLCWFVQSSMLRK